MRAAVFEGPGRSLEIVPVDIRDPGPGEVLVRVAACGVCHSDLSVVDGDFPSPLPVVLGHEAAGVVEAVGPGVGSVAPGDHVVLAPLPACGVCRFCTRNQPTLCARYSSSLFTSLLPDGTTPLSRDGSPVYRGLGVAGWAERALMPEAGVVRIDDDVPLEVACVIGCAVQTGVGAAFNTARVEPGDTVLVLGAGGIGIAVVQGARIAGAARIIVSDPVPQRREAALRFGATHTVDPGTEDPAARAFALTGGIGVDVAFEAAGHAALITVALGAVRPGGTVVCVGAPPLAEAIEIPMAVTFTASEKRLVGCRLGSVHPQRDIPRFLDLWREGRLDLAGMITERQALDEVNGALDRLRRAEGLRTVLLP